TSSRKELETRASRPSLSLLAGSHRAAHEVGASGKAFVLVTSVMYHETAPMPATRPSGYLLTKRSTRLAVFFILPRSSGAQRSPACPLSRAVCDIIDTSAG